MSARPTAPDRIVSRERFGSLRDVPPLTGRCLCGTVQFSVAEPPIVAGYCHCRRCQRRTGTAASPQARLAPGSLEVTAGADFVTEYLAETGNPKYFCSACGGALWSRRRDDREAVFVRLGAFDGDPGVRPSFRQFVAFAAPWESLPDDGLERFPDARP
jgi:hypothetical protein